MAIDLIDLGPTTPDGGKEGGVKINAMFTELYATRARVIFTAVTTATRIITDAELILGTNIFGVNYAGAVTITLPAGIDSDKLIVINDESGLAGTNNITLKVA